MNRRIRLLRKIRSLSDGELLARIRELDLRNAWSDAEELELLRDEADSRG